jgi:hypothetical protein
MPDAAEQRSANLQPRIADAITAFAGSMKFVYYTQWSSLSGCSPSRKALWPTLTSVASRIWFESWPSRTQVFGFGMSRGSRKWRTDALPEAAGHLVDPGAEDQRGVARLREAVYGTIVVLSVLAVLSESERSANIAALSIAGTSLVLFFAQVYAGSVAERIRLGREPGLGDLRRLAADSWPVAAVTLWPLVLLGLAGLGVMETATAIALAMWLAVAALGVWGWRAGQIGHSRVIGRLWSTALDLAVGLVIVGLEVAFR